MLKKNPLSIARKERTAELTPFDEFERRFEDWFQDFFHRPFHMMEMPAWRRWPIPAEEISPSVDVFEEGADVIVKAEIPGMKKEDIHVEIGEKSMTLSGEKNKEEKIEKKGYFRRELSYGSFMRKVALPADVQADKAKAMFKEGVLEVRVPKTPEAASRTRKVPIE